MLPALLAALLVQPPVPELVVRPVVPLVVVTALGGERRVAVSDDARGQPVVRLDALATGLGARLDLSPGRWVLRVGTTAVELRDGLPFAMAGDRVVPLGGAPYQRAERVWVPLQVATEVLPRLASGVQLAEAPRTLVLGERQDGRRVTPAAEGAGQAGATPDDAPVRLPTIRGRRPERTPTEAREGARRPRAAVTPTPDSAIASDAERRVTRRAERATPSVASTPVNAGDVVAPDGVRSRRTVVVDAGHGGPDAGMSAALGGRGVVREKDVTLGIARALRQALAARGLGVVLTRNRDTLVALADRGRIANQRRGDLFVSIHVNAANPAWREPAAERGFETYFLSEARTDDARRVAALENESVRFEGSGGAAADALGAVLADMAANEHLRESARLAALVQRRLARVHPGPSRGVKQAGFKVLVTANMPAILVEVGYGTNPAEAAWMASAGGQQAIAAAVAEAAGEYLRTLDARGRSAGSGRGR